METNDAVEPLTCINGCCQGTHCEKRTATTKTPATVAKNAARVYNKLAYRAENGHAFVALVWTHTAIRLEVAAKAVGPFLASTLREMASDARKRAAIARAYAQ